MAESSADRIDTEHLERFCHFDFLDRVELAAGNLLAVPEGGVENIDSVIVGNIDDIMVSN